MGSNFSFDSGNTSPAELVQILYDGDRPDCVQEIAFWEERYRTRSPLRPFQAEFINLSEPGSDRAESLGLSSLDYRDKMLIRLGSGEILENQDVFRYLEHHLGLGLLAQATQWPGVGSFFRGWYKTWITQKLPHTGRWSGEFASPLHPDPVPPEEGTAPAAIESEENFWSWNDSPKDSSNDSVNGSANGSANDLVDDSANDLVDDSANDLVDDSANTEQPQDHSESSPVESIESIESIESNDLDQLLADVLDHSDLSGLDSGGLDSDGLNSDSLDLDDLRLDDSGLDSGLDQLSIDNRSIDSLDDNLDLEDLNQNNLDLDNLDLDNLDRLNESGFYIIEGINSNWADLTGEFDVVESSSGEDLDNWIDEPVSSTGEVLSTLDLLDDPHELELNIFQSDEDNLDLTGLLDLDALERMLEIEPDSEQNLGAENLAEMLEQTDRSMEAIVDASESFDNMDTFIESAGNSGSIGSLGMPMGHLTDPTRHLASSRMDQTMKVPVRQLDGLSNLIAEMVVSRNCMEAEYERLRHFLTNLLYQMQQLSDLGQRFEHLYERSLLENALISNTHSFNRSFSGTSKAEHQKFDALEMDHFSEFHLLSQEMIELIVRARESASDIDYVINEPLDYIARHFRQVTTQVQEGLNRSRMVPFEQCTIRLPRAIREVALRSGKEATLVVEGKETLVDKVLLEQLYDPLTHLVNNAVIHGIESPEQRTELGKNPCGTITIRAFYQGNQTVIVIKDDGAGIDAERVRMKALQKGLINLMQAQRLKDIDMFDLIFNPGFSTRDQADIFAGRGVGMDVVKTRIESLRGTITVDSTSGKGTRFTIRLPLTLSITRALCCISSRAKVAFPMDSIEDMLDLHQDEVKQDRKQRQYIHWRDQKILFKPLSDLLKYKATNVRRNKIDW